MYVTAKNPPSSAIVILNAGCIVSDTCGIHFL